MRMTLTDTTTQTSINTHAPEDALLRELRLEGLGEVLHHSRLLHSPQGRLALALGLLVVVVVAIK